MAIDGKKLIRYMVSKGYEVEPYNIVYLEDVDPDTWEPVQGRLDAWDDARCVIKADGTVLFSNIATTEPGLYYTSNPLNPNGAARITIDQHKDAWALGDHKGQPALVQVNPIKVTRDFNKDGYRTGDKVFSGLFGVNQHSTSPSFNSPQVNRWSAGCMVGKFYSSHLQFIDLCRNTIRKANGKNTFTATVIDGSDLAAFS